jgi:hypothetical protein
VPPDKQRLATALARVFKQDPVVITHVGFLEHSPAGRIYFQSETYGTISFDRPIRGIEALANEMVRLAAELKYIRAGQPPGSIQMWELRKAVVENKWAIIAYVKWVARKQCRTSTMPPR